MAVIEYMSVTKIVTLPDGTIGLVGEAMIEGEEQSRTVLLKCAVQSLHSLPHSS